MDFKYKKIDLQASSSYEDFKGILAVSFKGRNLFKDFKQRPLNPALFVFKGVGLKAYEGFLRNCCKRVFALSFKTGKGQAGFLLDSFSDDDFSPLAVAKVISQEIFALSKRRNEPVRVIFFSNSKSRALLCLKMAKSYLNYIGNKLCQGPFQTVDAIIRIGARIVLIKRSNPPFGWALPGGFVDYNESLESAVKREAREETGLKLRDISQFHVYSKPGRDPRFHTISAVFTAEASGKPRAGSDAKDILLVGLKDIDKYYLAFDHKQILNDYKRAYAFNRR